MKILFLPLAVDAPEGALARAVSREIALRTGRAGGIECLFHPVHHMVEGRRVFGAWRRRWDAGDLARLLDGVPGSDLVVHGDLSPGDPFSLALEVLRRGDLSAVAERTFEAPRREGFRTVEEAARFVLEAAGTEELPEVLAARPTRTFEGYLALLLARESAAALDGWGEPADPFEPWIAALEIEGDAEEIQGELGLFAMSAVAAGLVGAGAAEAALRKALQAAPRQWRTWAALGQVRLSGGDPAGAEEALRTALEIDPGRASLRYDLGRALLAAGRAGPAAKALETVRSDPRCGPDALLALGRIRAAKDDLEGAVELWREAVALAPQAVEAWAALGSALASRGDLDDAEEAFRRGLSADRDCPELELGYGVHLAEQDRYGPAEEHLRKALRLLGTEPELHVLLGRVYAAEGDRRRALHHLRKAVRAGLPRGRELADELAGPGRSEELVRLLDEALEQPAGDQVPLLKGLLREETSFAEARIRLGIALVARGRPRAGERQFRKALKVEPEDPEAWSGLATALKARRKFERAIEAHEQAIRRAPRHEAYHLNLADTLLRAGRARDAARVVDRARALNPNHPLLPGFTVSVKQMLSEGSRSKEEG